MHRVIPLPFFWQICHIPSATVLHGGVTVPPGGRWGSAWLKALHCANQQHYSITCEFLRNGLRPHPKQQSQNVVHRILQGQCAHHSSDPWEMCPSGRDCFNRGHLAWLRLVRCEECLAGSFPHSSLRNSLLLLHTGWEVMPRTCIATLLLTKDKASSEQGKT